MENPARQELEQRKMEAAINARKELKAAMKTLLTSATFIDHHNQHTVEKYINMVNVLNRFIKSDLALTSKILNKEEDEKTQITRFNKFYEMQELINLLVN